MHNVMVENRMSSQWLTSPPGKNMRLSEPRNRCGLFVEQQSLVPLPGFEPRNIQPVTSYHTDYFHKCNNFISIVGLYIWKLISICHFSTSSTSANLCSIFHDCASAMLSLSVSCRSVNYFEIWLWRYCMERALFRSVTHWQTHTHSTAVS